MNNPWNTDTPFQVMFLDSVVVKLNCISTTVNACVFPIEDVTTFSDDDIDTNVKRFSVLILKQDWQFLKSLKIGDIAIVQNMRTKVTSIDEEQTWYRLTTRTI